MNLTEINLSESVPRWTNRSFIMRSGYYSGRGQRCGDLNSRMLELIYTGIAADADHATAEKFVSFVASLTDLSASAFIVAFQKWWDFGCPDIRIHQYSRDRYALSARGDGLFAEAVGCFMSALSSSREDSAYDIRGEFLANHGHQLR